jgi:hypothetical protein
MKLIKSKINQELIKMSQTEEQIFIKENLTQTKEYISPSKRYKLVVETYKTGKGTWDYTKGSIYSCSTNHWVGEVRRNYPHFPHLFFIRTNDQGGITEYLISGRDYTSQTIINCENGHIYDNSNNENRDPFCWSQMWQVDRNTLCVLGCYWGGSYVYSFFDFSNLNLGWKCLDVRRPNGLPMPTYDYILTHNDLCGQDNYPDPIIENGTINFIVKETRIFGIGINSRCVKEIDMELGEYKYQEDMEEGFKIPYPSSKTYQIVMAQMRYQRIEDHMVMIEFWRSESQMESDGSFDPVIERSKRCSDIYEMLIDNFLDKYSIRSYLGRKEFKWNISIIPKHTKSFEYLIEFDDEENTEIKVNYYNWRFREQDKSLSIWNQNGIVDLIV